MHYKIICGIVYITIQLLITNTIKVERLTSIDDKNLLRKMT